MEKIYKFFLTALCFSALSLSSCMKDAGALDVTVSPDKTFRATTELASRTTLDGDYNVIWSEGDQIVVFGITDSANHEGQVFTLSEGAGTTDGVFTGSLDGEFANYYAFYPYSMYSGMYISGEYVINLPTSAVFTEQNFVKDANPMIAYGTEAGGLSFKNLCGIAEFRIAGSGTINTIQVVSGDGQPIAGVFNADPRTLELSPAAGERDHNYMHIYASLENPIELSQTPRSIYAILPAGTYSNLSIRTIDDNGTLTIRTAKNDITVNRSHIVPVSQFTHTEKTVPYLSIHYLEEESDFYGSMIRFKANNASSGFHYRNMSYTDYESSVAAGKSDFEILMEDARTHNNLSGNLRINHEFYPDPDGKYVALGVPFDANGEYDQTNVSKLVFFAKRIPFTDEISVSIYGEPEITENSISLNIRQNTSWDQYKVLYNYLEKEVYDNITDLEKQYIGISTIPYGFTSGKDIYNISLGYLYPNREYVIAFSATDGIKAGNRGTYTRYANIQTYAFRTPAHTPSSATVSLAPSVIADWSTSIAATVSTGTTKIKYYMTQSSKEITADYVALYGTEMTVDASQENIIELANLTEESSYRIYAVAYDENDSYGVLSSLSFTTLPIIPVTDAEYDKFIGNYQMTFSNDSEGDASRNVTIEKGVEGRTFIVKGLISPSLVSNYSLDDTVTARFENGEFCLYCQSIASGGIYINLYNGTYLWYNTTLPLRSAYNNGVVTPRCTDGDMEWTGIFFSTGLNINTYLEYFTDFVLTKKTGTEGFGKDDETDAGWN